MRRLWILTVLLFGCVPADNPGVAADQADRPVYPLLVGRLEDHDIDEASGLARSQRADDLYWVLNDSGKPRLYAIDGHGADLGKVKVDDAGLSDWEDIASFSLGGEAYLLVADIGDNDAKRKDVRLYIIEEPEPDDDEVDVEWEFDFSYPDGPRDAEAVAVDAAAGRVLVLSKREVPAVLYELPLRPDDDKRQVAVPVAVPALPWPGREDLALAPKMKDWWWQPTGMDVSPDGTGLAILTYRGVFYFLRRPGEPWSDAVRRQPLALTVGDYDRAESIAFDRAGSAILVTLEGRGAPLVRIDLVKAESP